MNIFRTKNRPALICAAALIATLAPALAFAASAPKDSRPKHWLSQLGEELSANSPDPGKIDFVFGNEVWQPGQKYRNGDNWLALACDAQGCRLEGATLKVTKESWQGNYDNTPTAGQTLRFKLLAPARAKVIAWFNTGSPATWLKAGGITSYYTGIGRPKLTSTGTLEASIDLPDGGNAKLVPLLLSVKRFPKLTGKFSQDDPQSRFLLQLRADGKRQMLIGQLATCSNMVANTGYLLWAGDLDGDGKADYLISFIDASGPVHLYLSSQAKPGQIVGLAGVHESAPYGGECDGPADPDS